MRISATERRVLPFAAPVDRLEMARSLGKRVHSFRRGIPLTQAALAERSGLHTSEVSLIERGGREPRLTTIIKLAVGLEVPAGELIDEIDLDGTDTREYVF